MITRRLTIGCLGLLTVLAGAGYLLSSTETGRTITGLVVVYGGAMVGGALAYEVVPGVVTEVRRIDPPTAYSAGRLAFSYIDDQGEQQIAWRRVMLSTPKFRDLEVGDKIAVRVCRDDRSIVRLVGYGTHEPQTCGSPREVR